MALLLILIFLLLLSFGILVYFFYRLVIAPGAIYYPTPTHVVRSMLDLAKIGPNDTILDLGSGDGRILIEAAKRGAHAIGYEIDPLLVRKTRKLVKNEKLSHLVTVHNKNMWQADFDDATVITLYLFPNFMNRLQKNLESRLNHKIKLVSHNYRFPKKKEISSKNNIYLYSFP